MYTKPKFDINITDNRLERIEVVDGLRFVAVMSVVLYHYYYRFSPPASDVNHYPYFYDSFFLVKYGYFGVQLFFVISGFVIFHTLENSATFKIFIVKRFIRLIPSLLICSSLTFFVMQLSSDGAGLWNIPGSKYLHFLPGLTFMPPVFWNFLLGRSDIAYIDGSYWSLFPEMLFYLVGGMIYFMNRSMFTSNWLRLTFILVCVRIISSPKFSFLYSETFNSFFDIIYRSYLTLHISYWVYFALGIFFYGLYNRKRTPTKIDYILIVLLSFLELVFLEDKILRFLFMGMLLVFTALVMKKSLLSFLSFKPFVWIGMISYPVYLLHANIGIIVMNKFSSILQIKLFDRYMPIFAFLVILFISFTIYKFIEKPMIKKLKMILERG